MARTRYIGVDLGGTNVKAGLVDGSGNVLVSDRRPTNAQESADAPVNQIVDAINSVMAEGGVTAGDIVGIGIGSPGPLNAEQGIILRAGNLPHWFDFPLADRVSARIGVPSTPVPWVSELKASEVTLNTAAASPVRRIPPELLKCNAGTAVFRRSTFALITIESAAVFLVWISKPSAVIRSNSASLSANTLSSALAAILPKSILVLR